MLKRKVENDFERPTSNPGISAADDRSAIALNLVKLKRRDKLEKKKRYL